jgi:hypothetical protein
MIFVNALAGVTTCTGGRALLSSWGNPADRDVLGQQYLNVSLHKHHHHSPELIWLDILTILIHEAAVSWPNHKSQHPMKGCLFVPSIECQRAGLVHDLAYSACCECCWIGHFYHCCCCFNLFFRPPCYVHAADPTHHVRRCDDRLGALVLLGHSNDLFLLWDIWWR